jgi:EAL domain-containing protein (putative c-di-GMP-specific phosphodiesterase class I)
MGIRTVAEFAEETPVLEQLALLGVDYAQGFGISQPQPMIHELVSCEQSEGVYTSGQSATGPLH